MNLRAADIEVRTVSGPALSAPGMDVRSTGPEATLVCSGVRTNNTRGLPLLIFFHAIRRCDNEECPANSRHEERRNVIVLSGSFSLQPKQSLLTPLKLRTCAFAICSSLHSSASSSDIKPQSNRFRSSSSYFGVLHGLTIRFCSSLCYSDDANSFGPSQRPRVCARYCSKIT